MAIRNMDKITFDGDQIKFPASAILQEDLEGDISELKSDLTAERYYVNEKCSTYLNAFNSKKLDDASGINCVDGVYIGANTAFGAIGAIPVSCETGKQYTLSLDYYAEENTSTGRGLSFVVTYSNDSVDSVDLLNTATTLTHLSFTTDANKTVVSITPTVRTGTGNIFHVKNIMLVEGTTEKTYVPYYIPNDLYARNRIDEIEGYFDSIAVNYYDKNTFTADKVINGTGTNVSTSTDNGFMGIVPFKPKAGVYCCFINGVPARNKVQIYLFKNNALGSESFITRYIPTKNLSAFYITPTVATQCNYLAINLLSSHFDTGETATSVNNAMMLICLDDIKVNVPYTAFGTLFRKNSNSEYIKDKSVYLGRWHFDNKFQCVAYSGSKNGYPPNTRESYEGYALAGFDGIKGDVRVTSDNKLVMCHDPGFTFDGNGRITTYNSSDATAIIDMTFEDVMELEYAMKPEGADYVHPATPEDLIQVCKRYGKAPYITIRNERIPDVVAPAIYDLLKKYNIVGNTIINCVTLDPLFSMRALDDDITLSFVAPYDVDPTALENVYFANALGNCQFCLYIADGYSMTKAELETKISARSDLLELCDTLGVRKAIGQIGNADCLELSFDSAFGLAQTTVTFT